MTAPSKSFTSIPDSSIDADSPIDQTLLTAIRDNLVHLEEWLGGSYTAAVDHNHDGVNSAAIEIGPNLLRNGSFESGTASWTATQYSGGTIATNTSNDLDGATAIAITSTVLANGGGDLLSNEFVPVTGDGEILVKWAQKASAANISSKVEVVWYDDAQSSISTTVLHTSTNTNTTAKKRQRIAIAPSNARYCKVKLTGGIPATGSSTGTVYFDGVKVTEPVGGLILLDSLSPSAAATVDMIEGFDGSFDAYEIHFDALLPATNGVGLILRSSSDGGATFTSGASTYGYATSGIDSAGTAIGTSSNFGNNGILMSGSANISNVASNGACSGVLRISKPDSTEKVLVGINMQLATSVPSQGFLTGVGVTQDYGAAVNAWRLLFTSGNVASGAVRVYGVRKGS